MKFFFQLLVLFLMFSPPAFGQADSSLKTYIIEANFDKECSADIVVTLFDEALKMDQVNQVILDELLRGYYHTGQSQVVTLKNFYANKNVEPTGEMMFTIGSECSFHKNGVYSFIACPYNVCEKTARSNFESNCLTIDLKSGKTLSLDDIIDPLKRDSFDKYVYYTVTRYHLKNIPACYISSFHPVNIRGSNNVFVQTDTITYLKGLTGKFYLKENNIFVFSKVKHRDYNCNSLEVMMSLFYLKYFLKPEMVNRLGLK